MIWEIIILLEKRLISQIIKPTFYDEVDISSMCLSTAEPTQLISDNYLELIVICEIKCYCIYVFFFKDSHSHVLTPNLPCRLG